MKPHYRNTNDPHFFISIPKGSAMPYIIHYNADGLIYPCSRYPEDKHDVSVTEGMKRDDDAYAQMLLRT